MTMSSAWIERVRQRRRRGFMAGGNSGADFGNRNFNDKPPVGTQ
jgi:hypothetical protein